MWHGAAIYAFLFVIWIIHQISLLCENKTKINENEVKKNTDEHNIQIEVCVFMNVDRLISFGVWYYHFFYPCLIFMHKVLKARYCISADIMHAVVGSVCVFIGLCHMRGQKDWVINY